MNKISVLGAGTFGISLARLLANKGFEVTVYVHNENKAKVLRKTNRHERFKDVLLPDSIVYTSDLKEAFKDKEMIVYAIPSTSIREVATLSKEYVEDGQYIVDVAKGMEKDSLLTLAEVIDDVYKNDTLKYVVLSGPTHAEEVIKDMPTAIVAASKDLEAAKVVQETFSVDFFRVYTNEDIRGIEICGALKNIMAIAAGLSDGLGFGDNAKAALITRGLQEIKRLGTKMGCQNDTFFGLAGIGDLIVTCTSVHSRNNCFGHLLGEGKSIEEAKKEIEMVVEGLNALPAAIELADKYNVEMPITSMLSKIVYDGLDPYVGVDQLFKRELKSE